MWITTYGREIKITTFLARRVKRLVPSYWFVTSITAVIAVMKPTMFYSTVIGSAELVQSMFFIPYYRNTGFAWPIVIPGWTLNIEMFFYAIFALSLRALLKNDAAYRAAGKREDRDPVQVRDFFRVIAPHGGGS
jgi:exopolysaccharide production protein ExoZ